jgi:small subunit ribosomal protein S1
VKIRAAVLSLRIFLHKRLYLLMHNPSDPEFASTSEPNDSNESFGELLSQYEQSHSRKDVQGDRRLEGTVIKVTGDSVLVDIGFKTEGILPLSAFTAGETVKPGDKLYVTNKGRGPEGYYELTRGKVRRPTDWPALERAFADKATILGTVTSLVKGGLTVDVGVRAFLPASRSGTRDAAEMEKLVGQEIRCRITKLDVTDEDVVVDRRAVLEEEQQAVKERRYSELKEGDTVAGTVRSLAEYGAFVDIGGVDALLHVSDIAWSRVAKASDVLSVGQEVEARVLKITSEPGKRRVSIGLKQLQPHPWDAAAEKYRTGERVRGAVTRVMDFGAFVELEPGVEGLIHLSEMSWAKKVRKPSDVVKPGETVEAVILGVNPTERRISLGLKQALGDPWAEAAKKFPAGTVIEGPVVSVTKFGAFVQLSEGVEGMIHVSEMSADKHINHPQDVVRLGQAVKAQVLAIDSEKRQMRLSMKQLVPTGIDEYLAEHKPGDLVTGRVVEISGSDGRVELGEGVFATCHISAAGQPGATQSAAPAAAKADLSSLSSMLQARWKSGTPASGAGAMPKSEELRAGQIRSFRVAKLDPAAKKIEVELA